MIKQLYIKNFALIDELDIPFYPGFSVITGETGAGKSIILGAIGLLLGQRADTRQIKAGCDKCIIEARFDLQHYNLQPLFDQLDMDYNAEETILRREITSKGKSRAFVNDSPVALSSLKELGEHLIDIHSQHQNLLLQTDDFQLGVVDVIAHSDKLLDEYKKSYNVYTTEKAALEKLRHDIEDNRKNEEFLKYQFTELDRANLADPEEQQQLEQEQNRMNHAEDIKQALFESDNLLSAEESGAVGNVKHVADRLKSLSEVMPHASELAERLESCYIDLKDVADEVATSKDDVSFDPQELERVNERLDTIYTLQHKYNKDSIAGLISLRDDLGHQLQALTNSDDAVADKQQQVDELFKQCKQTAAKLTETRKKAAITIEDKMKKYLIPLGIPYVRFKVDIQSKPLSANGADKVSFLFSANTGTLLQPVAQVASGGEIARVMLSLKAMISGTVQLPTIIFDEIDTGVSGRVAEQMAHMMGEMGEHNRQVISITHLPQIAAVASHQYKVEKSETSTGTVSHMTLLTSEQRVTEIAKMLSGSSITEAAMSNARELLTQNNNL